MGGFGGLGSSSAYLAQGLGPCGLGCGVRGLCGTLTLTLALTPALTLALTPALTLTLALTPALTLTLSLTPAPALALIANPSPSGSRSGLGSNLTLTLSQEWLAAAAVRMCSHGHARRATPLRGRG